MIEDSVFIALFLGSSSHETFVKENRRFWGGLSIAESVAERHVRLSIWSMERSGRHPPKAVTVDIRAALVSEETGSAFHLRGGVIH